MKKKAKITLNQRRVAKIIANQVRKGSKVNISEAMRQAGYSKASVSTVKVVHSKSWNDLLEEYLPDSLLASKANEVLNAVELKRMEFPQIVGEAKIKEVIEGKGYEVKSIVDGFAGKKIVYFFKPDYDIVVRSLDQAHKLKSKYAPEKLEITRPLSDMSEEEIQKVIEEGKKKFTK